MEQVILFDKSLEQRLQDYKDVLSGFEAIPVSSITREWSHYLELTMDRYGWQAIWKIPRITCKSLNIPFPSLVLVFVLNTNLQELLAHVQVVAVQDDIHIPEKHLVPLIQLWPTRDQDEIIMSSINNTANALDMLRFFYTNIFMPWDREDSDSSEWLSKHLESRLILWYDVKSGSIPRHTAEHLHSLLSEARRIQAEREAIELELMESETDVTNNPDNEKVQKLTELSLKMMKIKSEFKVLENPLTRAVIIRQRKELDEQKQADRQCVWLVHHAGKIDNIIEFLNAVQVHFPEIPVKFSTDLALTLETSNPNDIFMLNSGKHVIRTVGALEEGGILKGVRDRSDTIVISHVEDVMLDFKGSSVLLENLTIDASSAQYAIIVREGKLVISNCKIVGNNKLSTQQGIIVLSNGEVEIIDSEMNGFYTAIVGNSGSNIKLSNTSIHHVAFGMKIFDGCTVMAKKCTFQHCTNYGICVETENSLDEEDHKSGDFGLLNIVPSISTECVKGENNTKGDVAINQKCKIKEVHDMFIDSGSETTQSGCGAASDADMEISETTVMNETVIYNENPISSS